MNDNSGRLIATRGNRCTATILGYLEDQIYTAYPQISTETQKQIRSVIVNAINSFKDLAIDIVKSDSAVINDIWAQKLDEIHEAITKGRA